MGRSNHMLMDFDADVDADVDVEAQADVDELTANPDNYGKLSLVS